MADAPRGPAEIARWRAQAGPLVSIATALLSGAVPITELCRADQRLSQQQRAQIGLRRKPGTKFFYPAPSYSVYRDLLGKLDVGKMAEVFNIWLDEQGFRGLSRGHEVLSTAKPPRRRGSRSG